MNSKFPKAIEIQSIPVEIRNKNDKYIIFCPPLKSIGYSSESIEDAINDLISNMTIMFDLYIEDHKLEELVDKIANYKTQYLSGNISTNYPIHLITFTYYIK